MWVRNEGEHNGHRNFETWAFLLHITQTDTMLDRAREVAKPLVDDGCHPGVIGETVVNFFKEWCWTIVEEPFTEINCNVEDYGDALRMAQDVGSFWRVDDAAVGRHLIEHFGEA